MPLLALVGLVLGSLSALLWATVLAHPARPWMLRPREDEQRSGGPATWPSVQVVIPARNEEELLPRTLRALLAQDYPGQWSVTVVDDRSADRTAEVAHAAGAAVLRGAPLPRGWVGKVWALEQGARGAQAQYLLLTDADIRHSPESLRLLVAEAEAGGLELTSRMARLRCESPVERLLIPPFLFFFNLLYPMRWVNDGRRPAAAGGCILLRREALERAGGFGGIRGAVIDDIGLARLVRGRIHLALADRDVVSLREHPTIGSVWRMVARTAFAELRYSLGRLAAALVVLIVVFPLPPLLAAAGIALAIAGKPAGAVEVALPALLAWALQTALFLPTVRYFGLGRRWAGTLPVAGTLFGAMTLDSALRASKARGRPRYS